MDPARVNCINSFKSCSFAVHSPTTVWQITSKRKKQLPLWLQKKQIFTKTSHNPYEFSRLLTKLKQVILSENLSQKRELLMWVWATKCHFENVLKLGLNWKYKVTLCRSYNNIGQYIIIKFFYTINHFYMSGFLGLFST